MVCSIKLQGHIGGGFMTKVLTLSVLDPPGFQLLLCSSWYKMRLLGSDWSLCWLPPSLSHTLAPSPGQIWGLWTEKKEAPVHSPSSWPRAPPAQCSPSVSSPRASSAHRPTAASRPPSPSLSSPPPSLSTLSRPAIFWLVIGGGHLTVNFWQLVLFNSCWCKKVQNLNTLPLLPLGPLMVKHLRLLCLKPLQNLSPGTDKASTTSKTAVVLIDISHSH